MLLQSQHIFLWHRNHGPHLRQASIPPGSQNWDHSHRRLQRSNFRGAKNSGRGAQRVNKIICGLSEKDDRGMLATLDNRSLWRKNIRCVMDTNNAGSMNNFGSKCWGPFKSSWCFTNIDSLKLNRKKCVFP